jgi:formate-dependent nitrite reductase membrane component NrfD
MLWILFLVSGLSSAAAFVHLISKDEDESRMLAKADNGFLVAEIMVIFLIIIGYLSSSQVMTEGANLILSGPYAATFWVLVFGMGIVIPLIIQLFAVNLKIQHTPVAPILVMLGGLALRFVIVFAGQDSHWSTAVYHLP